MRKSPFRGSGQVVFRALYTFQVPEDKRMLATEFITRVNYQLAIGALEMDLADGEVAVRTGIAVRHCELTPLLLHQVILTALATTQHYLPGLAAICFLDVSVQAALKQCEQPASLPEVMRAASDQLADE